MKKFNKQIQVTVEVDQIATQLLASFTDENPHKEMITETIIESMLQSGHVSLLYNNLNGWTNELNFKVGQQVNCTEQSYFYDEASTVGLDLTIKYEQKYRKIGSCSIREINVFRSDDVLVEYDNHKKDGTYELSNRWVKHDTLTEIPA